MTAQKGRDVVIKLDISGTFTTIAGIKQASGRISDGHTDVSSADSVTESARWRQMLAATGVKSMSLSGSGVFKDSAAEAALLTAKLAGAAKDMQFIMPGLGTFEGSFVLGDLEYAGNFDGEATYSMAFESADEITFTAE